MSLTDLPTSAPSRKVLAATGAAGLGSALVAFIVGILDDHVYAPATPDSVPVYVVVLLVATIPPAVTYAAGWWTRRGLEELAPPQPPGQHVRQPFDDAIAQLTRSQAATQRVLQRLEDVVVRGSRNGVQGTRRVPPTPPPSSPPRDEAGAARVPEPPNALAIVLGCIILALVVVGLAFGWQR